MNDQYDLEDRLLDYSVSIIKITEGLPVSRPGNHIAGQLLRSGTSALPNHGEAQAAESRSDFVHKMSICLKELRESRRWIRLILRAEMAANSTFATEALNETEELIRIFASSIRTARQKPKG